MYNLGLLYYEFEEFKKAKKYYKMASDHGNSKAKEKLEKLYKEQKDER